MIELKNISKKFGSRQLFSDTNLHFEGGKIYALIGTSGCGKTTLLNMIGRLSHMTKGKSSMMVLLLRTSSLLFSLEIT